jgi:hypothetical protein
MMHSLFAAKRDVWCSGCANTHHKRPANRQSPSTGPGSSPSTERLIDPIMHNLLGPLRFFFCLCFC